MKNVRFVSDYTSIETPNNLSLTQSDDGDIILDIWVHPENKEKMNKSVQIAMSGSRLHKNHAEIVKKFSEIIDLINENLQE